MANLTNSAKLISEMEKKANTTDLGAAALSNQYSDLDGKPTIPTVNNSTITIQKNSSNVDSFTTNASSNKTINIELTKADVGLGNVDNTSDANKPVSNATQTALNAKANASDVYTKAEVDAKVSSVYKYKGSKTDYNSLPSSGNVVGDVWNVEAAHTIAPVFPAGSNLAWDGSAWDVLGGTVDLTNYFNKTTDNSDSITQGSNNLFLTGAERTKLGNLSGTNTGDETTATIKTKLGAASASQDGYLKKEDFATFNGKQDALTAGDGITIENGVISSEGESYNAGEGIEIGNVQDYSAMQGPAPSGFHVPSDNERITLCGILTTTFGLSKNATTMGTYLKMPMAGYRYYWSSNVENAGTYGRYWCYTPYSAVNAYCLYFRSSSLNPQNGYGRANGLTVRCFKDSSTIPTSSWTTLYDGSSVASGAGIFWNSTDGLISVSGDGTTWYTIMDKNLGASTVFNQGDTLTDANCGYFYQWGNNYGFAHSGAITTSSTQVDASSYGPGNYYSSSTFITRISSPYDWSSVQNDNLWGGVTGVIKNAITNTGVLSVNGQTGNVTIGGIQLAPNTELDIKYHWYGSQASYDGLNQYYTDTANDTAYFTVA